MGFDRWLAPCFALEDKPRDVVNRNPLRYDDHGWWAIIVEFQPSDHMVDTYIHLLRGGSGGE